MSHHWVNNKCNRVKGRRWRWLIYALCNSLLCNDMLRVFRINYHCSWKFNKFHRKTPVLESLFKKVAGLRVFVFPGLPTPICIWWPQSQICTSQPQPSIYIFWPRPSIFVHLFFVLQLKFVTVTVSTYINSVSSYMY